GEISDELAEQALHRFLDGTLGIVERRPDGLARKAWQLAGHFGWAKTYDAEYLATAELLGCPLVTVDVRLRRGADRLGYVRTPDEPSTAVRQAALLTQGTPARVACTRDRSRRAIATGCRFGLAKATARP